MKKFFAATFLILLAFAAVHAETLRLVNGREYPYGSTSASNAAPWKVAIDTMGTNIKSIRIFNYNKTWPTSSPLYPTTIGQSLNNNPGKIASFGEDLANGTLGKNFAKVEFKGFDFAGKYMTNIKVGKSVVGGLNGLTYTGKDATERYVPFYYKTALAGSDNKDQNRIFNAYSGTTAKTLYLTLNKGTSANPANRSDYNFTARTNDIINNKKWIIIGRAGAGTIEIDVGGKIFPNLKINSELTVDGTTYEIRNIIYNSAYVDSVVLSVDGYLAIGQNNFVGQSGGLSILDSNNTQPKLYFTEGTTTAVKIDLDVDSRRKVYYVPKVTTGYVFFFLSAQAFDEGDGRVIQSGKKLTFLGTAVPANDGLYIEDNSIDYPYYSPKDADFNIAAGTITAAGVYTSSKAFHVANFSFNDMLVNKNTFLYIDTADGGLPGPHGIITGETSPTIPTYDAAYMGAPYVIYSYLTSGSKIGYYTKAYLDTGTKISLDTNKDTINISSPDTNAYVQIVVYGDSNAVETSKLYRVLLNSASGKYEVNNTLAKYSLPFLKEENVIIKVDNNTSSIIEKETIRVIADAQAYFGGNPYDLITTIGSNGFYYQIDFNGTTEINLGAAQFTDSGADDQIPIYLFGKKYYLDFASFTLTKEVRLNSDVNSG